MFSGLIPGLNSIEPPEEELIGRITANLRSLLNLSKPCLRYFWRETKKSGVSLEYRTLFISSTSGVIVIVMLASLASLLYSKKKKKGTRGTYAGAPLINEAAGELPESDANAMTWGLLNDALFHENKDQIVAVSDAKYAEDLLIQEAISASLLTCEVANNACSLAIQARPTLNSELVKIEEEVPEPSQSFCEICLENIESWQMVKNETCSHSFCYDCTGKHIIARIQDNIKIVMCPGVNCNASLDFNACRLLIPDDILVRWDETLCKSLILDSQKLYCPFSDCSIMLINDSGEVIKEVECPACKRSFCALCHVPWHSEFTCKEFGKLNVKRRGREDLMVETLAKKKHWRKCPRCKMYVEKSEGCVHITCRCKHEFCYRCGSKWKANHGGCRPRP